MRSKVLLCVVAAVMALAPTANATNSKPPGAQWEPDFGAGCSFSSPNTDPTNPQSNHFQGTAQCVSVWGPDVVPFPTTAIGDARVVVTLQTCPHHHPQGPGYENRCVFNTVLFECPFSGPTPNTAIGACGVAYDYPPSGAVYFCTEYYWTETSPTRNYAYMPDADPVTPGKQCRPVT